MQGIVFDIQKFALYDGPGIRTVVFLKGCPLKCVWCCNPESQLDHPQLSYNEEKCRHCFSCVDVCPEHAHLRIKDQHQLDYTRCRTNGKCVDECAYDALKIIGREMDAGTVLKEVIKDKKYFDKSGGGLTLSGGEPLAQLPFALELLKRAKQLGLNTCLETSGYAPIFDISRIQPYVDYFLYDYKITGNNPHMKYTGVPIESILENLDYLYKKRSKIILRCPIIPDINDTTGHFQAITELSRKKKNLTGIEIKAYYDMGKSKAKQVGMTYPLKTKTVSEEKANEWLQTLKDMGCKNVKRG